MVENKRKLIWKKTFKGHSGICSSRFKFSDYTSTIELKIRSIFDFLIVNFYLGLIVKTL